MEQQGVTITNERVTPSNQDDTRSLLHGSVIRNFMFLGIAGGLEALIGLFGSIYARRVLGVAVTGQVLWAAAIVSYLGLLVSPGFDVIARREVARSPRQAEGVVTWMTLIQAGLAVIGVALALTLSHVMPRAQGSGLLIVLHSLGLLLIPFDLRWLLQARERILPIAAATLAGSLLQFGLTIMIVREPSHVVQYILLTYPVRILMYGFIFAAAMRHGLLIWGKLQLSPTVGSALVRNALPIALANVTILLYNNFDAVLLGIIYDAEAVGLYRTAYNLMMVAVALLDLLDTISFPIIARTIDQPERACQVSEEFLCIAVWAGGLFSALGWGLGRHIIALFFGPAFVAAGEIFEWLSLNVVLIFFNVAYNRPLQAWGEQVRALRNNIFGSLVNVSANLLLIPLIGLWGAVITTLLSEIVVMISVIATRRSVHPVGWFRIGLGVLLVGGATALLARLCTTIWWPLGLIVGLLVFGAGTLCWEYRRTPALWAWLRQVRAGHIYPR